MSAVTADEIEELYNHTADLLGAALAARSTSLMQGDPATLARLASQLSNLEEVRAPSIWRGCRRTFGGPARACACGKQAGTRKLALVWDECATLRVCPACECQCPLRP